MSSPTVRSLKKLREDGYMAEVVEKWQPFHGPHPMRDRLRDWFRSLVSAHVEPGQTPSYLEVQLFTGLDRAICELDKPQPLSAGVHKDLFGFGDILAVKPGEFLIVQTTSAANQSTRRSKIVALPEASTWIKAGGKIIVHGWRKKLHKPGGKAMRWHCNENPVTADDIQAFEDF